MKWISWLYLVIYSVFVVLMEVMSLVTQTGSIISYIQGLALLLPSYVLLSELRGKVSQIVLSVVGLIAIMPLIDDAHKYSSLSLVTPIMYAIFIPMTVYMARNI